MRRRQIGQRFGICTLRHPGCPPPRPAAAVVPGRCPKHLLPLPPEAVARAADQARIQAFFLYRGSGPAVVVRSALAPYTGPRGDEVDTKCGMRVFQRTLAVDLLFPKMLPSASLSQGHGLLSLFGTGYRVWEVAH